MPSLAKKAVLDLEQQKLFIDGEEFPWYITEEDGVQIKKLDPVMSTLTFSMLVDEVEVIPASPEK